MEFRSLATSFVFIIIAVLAFIGVANNLENEYGGVIVSDDLNRTQTSITGLQDNFGAVAQNTGDTVTPESGQGETDSEQSAYKRAFQAFGKIGDLMGIGKSILTDTAVLIGLPADSFITELVVWLFIFVFAISFAFIIFAFVGKLF